MLHTRWEREGETRLFRVIRYALNKEVWKCLFFFSFPVYWIKQLLTHTLLLWRRLPWAKATQGVPELYWQAVFYISFRLKALKPAQVESTVCQQASALIVDRRKIITL